MANDPIVLDPPQVVPFLDGFLTGVENIKATPTVVSGFDPARYRYWDVPPMTPAAAAKERPPLYKNPSKLLVYINGINTLRRAHAYTIKLLSVVTGAHVVGIYNQSGDGGDNINTPADLLQSLGDKLGISNNPTTNTLEKAIFDACTNGVYLNVVAHSQGAIIASRGTRNAIRRLRDFFGRQDNEVRQAMEHTARNRGFLNLPVIDSLTTAPDERRLEDLMRERIMPIVERALRSYVTIQTFGGAANRFPDGPVYRHVLNDFDNVAQYIGLGNPLFDRPGRDAQVVRLQRDSNEPGPEFSADHSIDAVYLQPSQYYVDLNNRRVDQNYIPVDMSLVR